MGSCERTGRLLLAKEVQIPNHPKYDVTRFPYQPTYARLYWDVGRKELIIWNDEWGIKSYSTVVQVEDSPYRFNTDITDIIVAGRVRTVDDAGDAGK